MVNRAKVEAKISRLRMRAEKERSSARRILQGRASKLRQQLAKEEMKAQKYEDRAKDIDYQVMKLQNKL